MALQIRRGTNAERQLITPLQGEMIFTTDTKKLFVGDGTTAGGIAVDTTSGGGGGTDTNTTYLISAETASGGANLRLTGSDASVDDVKLAAGANVTITRTDASTITIASTATSTVANLSDLDDVAISGTPSSGQVLKWNGTAWAPGTDNTGGGGGGATTLDELLDVVITGTPANGEVLSYNGTNWANTTALTANDIRDEAAAIFTEGTHTGISFTYDNVGKTLDATVNVDLSTYTGTVTGTFKGNVVTSNPSEIVIVDASTGTVLPELLEFQGFTLEHVTSYQAYEGVTGLLDFTGLRKELGVNGKLVFLPADGGIKIFSNGTLLDETPPEMLSFFTRTNNVGEIGITSLRSRGTDPLDDTTALPVQNGDALFGHYYTALADETTGFIGVAAATRAEVSGTVNSTAVPGRFIISTGDTLGNLNDNFIVDENGVIGVASNTVTAGVGSGEVDTSAVLGYLKVVIGGVEAAIPYYAINP